MCVDYRRLNSITNPDPYYIPLVDELLLKVGSSQVLSKLDLAKVFIRLDLQMKLEQDQPLLLLWVHLSF